MRFAGAEPVTARFIVGADGARSRVARDLGLDVNRRFLVGAEIVHPIASGTTAPAFHCVLDPRVAPGYLGWVIDDGRHAHVGVAGYPAAMRAGVRHLLDTFAADAPGRAAPTGPVERRGGPIPVGGVLRRLACPAGLLVGDAAGAVSPLTAGGLDPCLRMSELAAAVAAEYLRTGDQRVLRRYDGAALRARFRGRLLLRRVFAGIRSPAAAEAAVALLRGRAGRAAAARILFGDGSFPDVTPDGLAPAFGDPGPRLASIVALIDFERGQSCGALWSRWCWVWWSQGSPRASQTVFRRPRRRRPAPPRHRCHTPRPCPCAPTRSRSARPVRRSSPEPTIT